MPWSGDGDKLRDQVMREPQKLVAEAATSEEYISQSKTAAEVIIGAFLRSQAWRVEVKWAAPDNAPAAADEVGKERQFCSAQNGS